jgi:hypothetical protein
MSTSATLDSPRAARRRVLWRPMPKQHQFIRCPVEDVLFGGARGPGKTDGIIGDWLNHARLYTGHARGILIRQSYPAMEELEARCQELFPGTGGRWNVARRTWRWGSGSRLRLRHLERESDANAYQGHGYTWVGRPWRGR